MQAILLLSILFYTFANYFLHLYKELPFTILALMSTYW